MPPLAFSRPHFVVNGLASRRGAASGVADLRAEVARVFPGSPWRVTTRSGEATELAREAAGGGADLVVAVGGDGTINEVVNGLLTLAAPPPPLGILPAGSGSDFVRSLGIRHHPAAAVAVLNRGTTRRIDVGEIECATLDPEAPAARTRRYFLNIAGCGASGRVVERFNRWRVPGVIGYGVAAALTAFDYRWPQVRITLDDGADRIVSLNLIFVCNGEYCGGGMHVGKGARLDDGMLHVVEAGGVSRVRAMLQWPSLYRGTLYGVRGVRVDAARSVTITGERDVLVDCDGELAGRLPATYRVISAALDVCVPEGE